MARGAMAAIDEYNATAATKLTYGFDKTTGKNRDIIIMGFDCNEFAMKNVLDGKWNYEGQCSPFQAIRLHLIIQALRIGSGDLILEAFGADSKGIIINEETFFEAKTITQADIDKYNIG